MVKDYCRPSEKNIGEMCNKYIQKYYTKYIYMRSYEPNYRKESTTRAHHFTLFEQRVLIMRLTRTE